MNRTLFLSICMSVLLAGSLFGGGLNVGSEVGEFTVKSVAGEDVQYSSVSGDITVIGFIATKCPISNDYNERMAKIYDEYAAKGVKFVYINSNRAEDAAEVKAHAAEHGFGFAVYKDPGNIVADQFGATVTPEVYVVKAGKIVYHGRIDDARTGPITDHSLTEALNAVLAGKGPAKAETKAFGCTIKRVKAT